MIRLVLYLPGDSWAPLPGWTHHAMDEVTLLLDGFEIEEMRQEERDDPPGLRSPQHWHRFHVVASKH